MIPLLAILSITASDTEIAIGILVAVTAGWARFGNIIIARVAERSGWHPKKANRWLSAFVGPLTVALAALQAGADLTETLIGVVLAWLAAWQLADTGQRMFKEDNKPAEPVPAPRTGAGPVISDERANIRNEIRGNV